MNPMRAYDSIILCVERTLATVGRLKKALSAGAVGAAAFFSLHRQAGTIEKHRDALTI
jgi:hypothetical protein